MNWHDINKETPTDMQRVIVTNGTSIGVGFFHDGKYGFGLGNVMVIYGPYTNLGVFTHWISMDEMIGVFQ